MSKIEENNELSKKLEITLGGEEFTTLGMEISEVAIDSLLNEGFLRDVPIVSTFAAVFKTGRNIRDAIFLKKLLIFLSSVQETPKSERIRFLKEFNNISEKKNRLFEKILMTIDKLDDSAKASILAKAFKHLIVGNIDIFQYYKISRVIEEMLLDEIDFYFLKYGNYERTDESREKYFNYISLIGESELKSILIRCGLLVETQELKSSERFDSKKYKIEKKDHMTKLGRIFSDLGFEPRYLKIPIQ